MNARGTMSSAGKSFAQSGFKWSMNNRALAPAFVGENKENGVNGSLDNIDEARNVNSSNNGVGVLGVRSLVMP